MIHEAVDAAFLVARALAVWIVIGAAVGTVVVLGVATAVAWAVKQARRPLSGRLRDEDRDSVPREPGLAKQPPTASWAHDPHDTGETAKPPVPA